MMIQEFRVGLHRGMSTRKPEEIDGEMAWASWVDVDDDVVDFHRPEMFGVLNLLSSENNSYDVIKIFKIYTEVPTRTSKINFIEILNKKIPHTSYKKVRITTT